MVTLQSRSAFICLALTAIICLNSAEAASNEGEYVQDVHVQEAIPEERKFSEVKRAKLAPLIQKKNWLLSLFGKHHEPEPTAVHTLAPLEHLPIWKVHKYKGIEIRPVQVVDVPTSYGYPVPAETTSSVAAVQYSPSAVDPLRMPHAEYGPPRDGSYQFNDHVAGEVVTPVKGEPGKIVSGEIHSFHPVSPSLHGVHAEKLRAILETLKSHKINKLNNLRSWKGALRSPTQIEAVVPANNAVLALPELPEVAEVPVGGLENLNIQIPELPPINLPSYASALTTGPYLKVTLGSPLPILGYAAPQYMYYQPVHTYQGHVPAPYYGAPPLFDSYGTPLPPDAYAAPSDQIPTFAVPESSSHSLGQLSNDPPVQYGSVHLFNDNIQSTQDFQTTKFAFNGSDTSIGSVKNENLPTLIEN